VQRVHSDKGSRSEGEDNHDEDFVEHDLDDDDTSGGDNSQLMKKAKSRKGQVARRQISKFLKRKKKAAAPAIKKILFHWSTQLFLGFILMLSLFLPDSWTIINPMNKYDVLLNVVLVTCIAVFTIEIIVM
jgi:hypothetical protein